MKDWIERDEAYETFGYTGLKFDYRPDVKTTDGQVYTNCYLNAGKFNGRSETDEFSIIDSDDVTHIRLNTIEEWLDT